MIPDQEPNEQNIPSQPLETDTDRIVHRHLQNKDDIITDEDIRSVRVGLPAEGDKPTVAVQALLHNDSNESSDAVSG